MKKWLLPLSYVLVILATMLGTLFFTDGNCKLEELEDLLADRFVDGVDRETLEEAAAKAMVEALGDRWSYYIPAEEYASYQENQANRYVGIGVTVQTREDGCLTVVKVTPNGPAQAAGILAGDVITAADGQSIVGQQELIRGPEGTTVILTVLRGGVEHRFAVTRATVNVPVATGQMLPDHIGLVTIQNFNTNCYRQTMAAVEELVEAGAEALIFDVRFNGGGYKSEMIEILDDLLPEGELFHSQYYDGRTSVDKSDSKCLDMPMAVLINSQSYSAAEFFGAALREYDWAILVGEQTVGKGHFQVTYKLSDGSAVAVSVGRYTTPNGVDLEGVGLTPDLVVEVTPEQNDQIYAGTLDPMEDPQVLAAIQALKSAEKP